MNAVIASHAHRGARDANAARALHLTSLVQGQLTKAAAAIVAGDARDLESAMLSAQQHFDELLDRTLGARP